MKSKLNLSVVIVMIMVLSLSAVITACQPAAEPTAPEPGKPEPAPVVKLKIGHSEPITSPWGPVVPSMEAGGLDWVKHVNDAGLIPGVELESVIYDSGISPALAAQAYNRFKEEDVIGIIHVMSTSADAIAPLLADDKMVLVSVTVTPKNVQGPGWMFSTQPGLYSDVFAGVCGWINDQRLR